MPVHTMEPVKLMAERCEGRSLETKCNHCAYDLARDRAVLKIVDGDDDIVLPSHSMLVSGSMTDLAA